MIKKKKHGLKTETVTGKMASTDLAPSSAGGIWLTHGLVVFFLLHSLPFPHWFMMFLQVCGSCWAVCSSRRSASSSRAFPDGFPSGHQIDIFQFSRRGQGVSSSLPREVRRILYTVYWGGGGGGNHACLTISIRRLSPEAHLSKTDAQSTSFLVCSELSPIFASPALSCTSLSTISWDRCD